MLKIFTKVYDQATKQAEERVKLAAQAHASGVGAAGFAFQKSIKTGMQAQAPGGEKWPEPSPWVQYGSSLAGRARQAQRRAKGRRGRKPRPKLYVTKGRTALKRLAGAVRYQKTGTGDETRVKVGFLSGRVAQLAAYHAEGPHTVTVTDKMRRLIFAVGLGISKKTISIPRRRHVEPVYEKNQALIPQFIRLRVNTALAGGDPKSVGLRLY